MIGFFLRRLLSSLLLLFIVLNLTFILTRLTPGEPTDRFSDPHIPREQSERLARLYGLDQPLPVQYWRWLKAVIVHWDWGISFGHLRPATAVLREFLPNTVILALGAAFFQYTIGLALGLAAARWPHGIIDHTIRIGSLMLYSLPAFWLGLMFILLLSHGWQLFPSGDMYSLSAAEFSPPRRLLDLLHHLILPAFVLGLPLAAEVGRLVRNALLEVLEQDYIRSARARGLSGLRVLCLHALRNAVVPLTQMGGISIGALLGGAFAVEVVFSWPGIGYLTFEAVETNDYPLILAATALSACLVVSANLGADLVHAVVDPRVRKA